MGGYGYQEKTPSTMWEANPGPLLSNPSILFRTNPSTLITCLPHLKNALSPFSDPEKLFLE